jgi:hypothetical protein
VQLKRGMERLPSELYSEIIKFIEDQSIRLVNQLFKKTYDFYYRENGVTLTITNPMFEKYIDKVNNFNVLVYCRQTYVNFGYFPYLTFRNIEGFGYEARELSQDNKCTYYDICGRPGLSSNQFVNPFQGKIFDIDEVYFPDLHCVKYFLIKHYLAQNNKFVKKSLENTYHLYNNFIKWRCNNAEFDRFYSWYFYLNV